MSSSQSGEARILIDNHQQLIALLGKNDEYLTLIHEYFPVNISVRDQYLLISGEPDQVSKVQHLFQNLLAMNHEGSPISVSDVRYGLEQLRQGRMADGEPVLATTVLVSAKGKHIRPQTPGQAFYLRQIQNHDMVLCVGPAGTGKTYLAVAMAVLALQNRQVERIILTRPAVEAGEKLGFLPGDLQEKVDPYLRPLYDALADMLGMESFQKYMNKNIIEVAPLAYMRGRTLDDAFIILDEAQNTTPEQMKMFLTRMGFGSKVVVTGDITQIDLSVGKCSGLKQALDVLREVPGICIVELEEQDVVRHELVSRIIHAYADYEHKRRANEQG